MRGARIPVFNNASHKLSRLTSTFLFHIFCFIHECMRGKCLRGLAGVGTDDSGKVTCYMLRSLVDSVGVDGDE